VASTADPEPARDAGPKLSLETRIALIGVVGALAGTLTGGLVTWFVTQDQLASQRADARRAERLDAYANYLGDASRLWTQVGQVYEVTPRPKSLSESETAALKAVEETLARDYALVALLAPKRVHDVARELNGADTAVWNALQSAPIDVALYREAKKKVIEGQDNLLLRFLAVSRKDLGTPDR
jgi:hypothetical protein